MDRIRYFADQSIRRACGFGFLALATGMVGLYWDIASALKLGATGATFMAALLVWKAFEAPRRNYRRTEVFLMMDKKHDFPEARAQQIFGNTLRDRYLGHATIIAGLAAILWLFAFIVQAVGAD
ncbi:MAG: hypothetical protein EXQ89_04070 [Rhodospirillaceae bacterium]|nr:hypothetical protein [Rhodospirillaceae bacterium]